MEGYILSVFAKYVGCFKTICLTFSHGFAQFRSYRAVQIVSNLHNEVIGTPWIQILVGGTTLAEIFSLHILITSHHVLPSLLLLFFSVAGIYFGLMIQIIFKIISYPYVKSKRMTNSKKRCRNRIARSYVRSCSPIKLFLGDGRFFDKLTSMEISLFTVDKLVTLLLLYL